jgi:hypothetical protein
MLGASGARLDRLEVLPSDFEDIGDGLVHLAQALRCCSPTLKASFSAATGNPSYAEPSCRTDEDYAARVERLRVQWADVLAGVSACRELQVLVLPASRSSPCSRPALPSPASPTSRYPITSESTRPMPV